MLHSKDPLFDFILSKAIDGRYASENIGALTELHRLIRDKRLTEKVDGMFDPAAIADALARAIRNDVKNVRYLRTELPFECEQLMVFAGVFMKESTLERALNDAWGERVRATLTAVFGDDGATLVIQELWQRTHSEISVPLCGSDSMIASSHRMEAVRSVLMAIRLFAAGLIVHDDEIVRCLGDLLRHMRSAVPVGRETEGRWLAVMIPLPRRSKRNTRPS